MNMSKNEHVIFVTNEVSLYTIPTLFQNFVIFFYVLYGTISTLVGVHAIWQKISMMLKKFVKNEHKKETFYA